MKVVFRQFTFEDFKGKVRPVTLCAVSQKEGNYGYLDLTLTEQLDKYGDYLESDVESDGVISVGLSICHETDLGNYSVEYGIRRAEGRAKKVKNCALVMSVSKLCSVTNDMLNTIADNVMNDFKRCPGKYIEGYNQMEENYLKD